LETYNVLISIEEPDIEESANLRIIEEARAFSGANKVFVIEASEEEVLFLTLKYGNAKVWKR
jgi:hypothetical protein